MVIIERFEVPGLSHYSYLVSTAGQAVVIDPKRDVDTYIAYAAANNLKITHILETHIHADYASGARELAHQTGAEMWLSAHDTGEDFEYKFAHHAMKDGDEFHIAEMRIVALHTPGHTPEHLSYALYDTQRSQEQPLALFSGDFVFVGSLGRPDLLGEAAKQKLAASLFHSLQEKLKPFADGVEIHPAHGAGSMCGAGMSDRPQSTLGYERLANAFFHEKDEKDFVRKILGSVPPFPDYYRRMKKVNSDGPRILGGIPGEKALSIAETQAAIHAGAIVVDLRRPEAFGGAHIPGSINIGGGASLATWASWILPYETPIVLVGDASTDYEQARRSLIRVGLDDISGYLKGGVTAWIEAGLDQGHLPQISVEELQQKKDACILDVRGDGEWNGGHIGCAQHIMAGDVPKCLGEIDRTRDIHVICGTGYRSSVAASYLKKHGFPGVFNVVGGMTAWKKRGLPLTDMTGATCAR
ncbi:MAG: MBL fold metallo-hydrolase [Terriglobales bacterium]